MRKRILQKGEEGLVMPSALITDFIQALVLYGDLSDTIDYLLTTHSFTRGIGLAAPQIGINKRMSIVRYKGVENVLINPEIIEHSKEKKKIREGCISFFEFRGNVPRFTYVKVRAQGLDGSF